MAKKTDVKTADSDDSREELRKNRLESLLQVLEKQGLTQGDIARRIDVPAQYLSDVKSGRRSLTELFARRFQDEFGVDYHWLLGNRGSMEVPRLNRGGQPTSAGRVWLPVFANPLCGDPFTVPDWDGSSVEIAGAAAMRVLQADRPYALRFGADDCRHRLRRGDLVLISQATSDKADIQVVKVGPKLHLARRIQEHQWEFLNQQASIRGEATVIGHCLGILWGVL